VLKNNTPKPENRSKAGHIGPYSFCFFVSTGDYLQLAEVFWLFFIPLLGQRLFYGKLFTPTSTKKQGCILRFR
jgi:hypothetical protein